MGQNLDYWRGLVADEEQRRVDAEAQFRTEQSLRLSAQAEIARLRSALEPFAAAVGFAIGKNTSDNDSILCSVRLFRRAALALAQSRGE